MAISKKTTATTPAALFAAGDLVVYPTHGVGKVTEIATQVVSGSKVKLFVISFAHHRMTLRVPLSKAGGTGLRKLSTHRAMNLALTALKGRPTAKRGIWNRRAIEYAAKINSGDLVLIAEVVRDLYRPPAEGEQSYSERKIYEQALERLTHEMAAVQKIEPEAAAAKLEQVLRAA